MLMYRFEKNPELLSDDAIWAMLNLHQRYRNVRGSTHVGRSIPAIGNTPHHMVFHVGVAFPETENHVLMINTWAYLINQWLRINPRADRRIERYFSRSPAKFENENSALETTLLAAMARIMHNDFFETNARPYGAYSLSALQLLYSYADTSREGGKKIRIAAQNALDFAATKFAFQSLYGKRLAPGRRNWAYRARVGLYEGDYLPFIFGMLSGAVSYDSSPECRSIRCAYHSDQAKGFALSAALSEYRIPDAVLDFMLHPDSHHAGYGTWARMQSRFTNRHYVQGKWPRLMGNVHGAPDLERQVRAGTLALLPAVELYFKTADFLNTAGGRYQHYSGQDGWAFGKYVHSYDWYSRPTSLLFKGNNGYWSNVDDASRELFMLRGNASTGAPSKGAKSNVAQSNNLGVYKNFAYGYSTAGTSLGAVSIPAHVSAAARFTLGNVPFQIFSAEDAQSSPATPAWVIVAELPSFNGAKRAFWEVVPRTLYETASEVATCVQERNPSFELEPSTQHDLGQAFEYRLCVSGESLTLAQAARSAKQPILAIDGDRHALSSLHFDESALARFPLIEVRQVDERYRFTGRTLVYSEGNGLITIQNPFLNQKLRLDSRDPLNPKRTLTRLPNRPN
jgi:hypothetical protein